MKNSKHEIPCHVAVIMDGNGRWAKKRLLPRLAGHRKGAESVRRLIESSAKEGVKYLTLYAFSTENWQRPQDEVDGLMKMLTEFIQKEEHSLQEQNIRFRIIGNRKRLPAEVINAVEQCEENTKNNDTLQLILALNYGGRDEIVEACKSISQQVLNSHLDIEQITEKTLMQNMYAPDIPDPDLIIRTSGEFRISNFLIWQCAYAEFVIVDKYWPDFGERDLQSAILEYNKRDRKYGKLSSF